MPNFWYQNEIYEVMRDFILDYLEIYFPDKWLTNADTNDGAYFYTFEF